MSQPLPEYRSYSTNKNPDQPGPKFASKCAKPLLHHQAPFFFNSSTSPIARSRNLASRIIFWTAAVVGLVGVTEF